MSRIRGTNTKPEVTLRRGLHAAGLRFRLHVRSLPGTPDIVFPKYGAVIQVNGCFWHGHRCALFKLPETRQPFWAAKIAANTARDARATQALHDLGWRVLVVWECALKGPARQPLENVIAEAKAFVTGDRRDQCIPARAATRPARP
jgi:DNA mismatch endonuclease (patch repair protein)